MQAYSAHIAKCGISKVSFNLIEVNGEGDSRYMALQGLDRKVSLNDSNRSFDVIGSHIPRGEKNLLADDITPSIVLLDLFRRPGAYGGQIKLLCTTAQGTSCGQENASDPLNFNPMFLVDARISDTKDYLWPKSLLRLFRNAADGRLQIADLRDLYGWKVRSEASCFQSLITTNLGTPDLPPAVMLPDNLFFSMNTLNRQDIGHLPDRSGRCMEKVLILNRYGKRFIEGSDTLVSAIRLYGSALQQQHSNVFIESEVVFFENSSFHEQVSVMQESNIVVASHGDGNANFIFLRPRSYIFEVFPFGFASDLYRSLSTTYGALYSAVHAQPDEDVFLSCVRHFNNGDSEEKESFIREWKAAAKEFTDRATSLKANVDCNYTVPEDELEPSNQVLRRLTQCASHQRISVHAKHLARMVIKAAAEQCNVQVDHEYFDKV